MKATLAALAIAILGGCAIVPAGPVYYPAQTGYYAPPPYYGPSLGISISGGLRGGRRGHR